MADFEPKDIGFMGASYEGRSRNINAQRAINVMVEGDPSQDNTKAFMVGTPGKTLVDTIGNGPIRGLRRYGTNLIVVSGSGLYTWNPTTGTATLRGTLGTSSGPVGLSDNGVNNGQQVMITDGTGYIWNSGTDTFAEITDPDFVGADVVGFLDGYFLFNQPDTDYLQISNQYDGTVMFGRQRIEAMPDNLSSIIVDHREVWLMGATTTEVWFNSGDADFPLSRFQGGFAERGIIAPFSAAKVDKTIIWLGANERNHGVFLKASEGFKANVASPPAINTRIANMSTITDAIAYTFNYDSHEVYICTFPTEDWTICFDASAPPGYQWHERSSNIGSDGFQHRDRGNCHAELNGIHYVGDYASGKLYRWDKEAGLDGALRIIRERTGRHIRYRDRQLPIAEVDIVMGRGQGSVLGDDNKFELRWSKDGGHIWGNWVQRSFGEEGQYDYRQPIQQLGAARDWLFNWRTSTATPSTDVILHEGVAMIGSTWR